MSISEKDKIIIELIEFNANSETIIRRPNRLNYHEERVVRKEIERRWGLLKDKLTKEAGNAVILSFLSLDPARVLL